jgi:predicted nicotinamide N-methyase
MSNHKSGSTAQACAAQVARETAHFSNILTQIILTAKQNLANITFVDQDQLDETTIGKIRSID